VRKPESSSEYNNDSSSVESNNESEERLNTNEKARKKCHSEANLDDGDENHSSDSSMKRKKVKLLTKLPRLVPAFPQEEEKCNSEN